jgi:hypothetical protein
MKPVAAIAACCLALGLSVSLAACGSDTVTDPAAEPTATTSLPTATPPTTPTTSTEKPIVLPACAGVWTAGARLPGTYRGCLDGGKRIEAVVAHCESGQRIVTYDDRYYAVPGAVINDVGDLKTSDQYHRAMDSCLG